MTNKNKDVALVTGATKGIGKAISLALAKAGYNLLLTARNEAHLAAFSVDIRRDFPDTEIDFLAVDLADETGCTQLLEWANDYDIYVLINNLGVFHSVSVLQETEEEFARQWQINYFAPYRLCRELGLKMVGRGRGHLVNITSVAAKNPLSAAGTYSVTKAALRSLTHVLREELRPHNVRVTELVPGSTKTDSWDGTTIPDSRFVLPEDVARALELALQVSGGASLDEVVITPRLGNI